MKEGEPMKIIKLGAILLTAVTLSGCVESYMYEEVMATVAHKEYDPPSYKTKEVENLDGTFESKRVYVPEEYEIIMQYEDISKEFEFSDSYLYEGVQVGDQLPMQLILGVDEEGTIITTDMEFAD